MSCLMMNRKIYRWCRMRRRSAIAVLVFGLPAGDRCGNLKGKVVPLAPPQHDSTILGHQYRLGMLLRHHMCLRMSHCMSCNLMVLVSETTMRRHLEIEECFGSRSKVSIDSLLFGIDSC